MNLTASDVRDVRFGTTRVRTGYNMAEVDAFLDTVEQAIAAYASESVRVTDEADALRSQVQQLQARLEALQAELAASSSVSVDADSTAENPVVVIGPDGGAVAPEAVAPEAMDRLLRVREDVRGMLTRQLELLDELPIPGQAPEEQLADQPEEQPAD